jgi:hypothetical protein
MKIFWLAPPQALHATAGAAALGVTNGCAPAGLNGARRRRDIKNAL